MLPTSDEELVAMVAPADGGDAGTAAVVPPNIEDVPDEKPNLQLNFHISVNIFYRAKLL